MICNRNIISFWERMTFSKWESFSWQDIPANFKIKWFKNKVEKCFKKSALSTNKTKRPKMTKIKWSSIQLHPESQCSKEHAYIVTCYISIWLLLIFNLLFYQLDLSFFDTWKEDRITKQQKQWSRSTGGPWEANTRFTVYWMRLCEAQAHLPDNIL